MNNVICIKWGNRYEDLYVNRLQGMLARNASETFKLHCFTDANAGIDSSIECHPIPEITVPSKDIAPGKWRKIALWSKPPSGLEGPTLFIDLDSVVTGPIDELFTHGSPKDIILARNWIKPHKRLGQTSVFRFPIGKHQYLFEKFQENPIEIARKHQFEQHYVTKTVKEGVKFWPSKWVKHFRMHCLGPWPLRYIRPAKLGKKTRIVTFPGKPDPKDAQIGRWSNQVIPASQIQHLRNCLNLKGSSKKKFNAVKRYLMPTPWIEQHWRE